MFASRIYRVCGWLVLIVIAPLAVLYGTPQRRQSINSSILGAITSHVSGGAGRAPVAIRPVPIHAALRGAPYLSLRDGQAVSTNYVGDSSSAGLLRSNAAQPVALASGDFDSDGVQDLVSGYAAGTGGIITIHRGNIDALFPYGAALRNGEPPAFLPNAPAIKVPEPPDFIGTGDFDADGHWDIVTAHLGSNAMYFLRGDGRGNFASPQRIALSGNITAFASGEMNRADGLTDIVVGVTNANGAQALVFESPTGAANATPEIFALPAPATSMALGMVEGGPMRDLAIGAGNQLVVIHGRDRKLSLGGGAQNNVPQAAISQQTLPFSVQALQLGSFSDTASLAVLGDDGAIHLMHNSNAIAHEIKVLSAPLKLQPAIWPGSASASKKILPASPSSAAMASRATLLQSLSQTAAVSSAEWTVETNVAVPASALAASTPLAKRFIAGHVSSSKYDDLILLDSQTNQVHVLSSKTTNTPDAVSGGVKTTAEPMTLATSLDIASAPAAILPMRVNQHGLKSLVMLQAGQAEPSIAPQTPANIFTVTNTSDVAVSSNQFTPGLPGSLRLAMQNAQAASGSSEIVFNIPTTDPNYNPSTGAFLFQPVSEGPPGLMDFNSLPVITEVVTIDGYTQPGASPNTLAVGSNAKILIQIDGTKATTPGDSGFQLFLCIGSVIRGMDVTGFGITNANSGGTVSGAIGILEEGASDFVEGNYLGVDPTGTIAMPNVNGYEAAGGPDITPNNPAIQGDTLGGTTPQQRNVISGNHTGAIIFPTPFLTIEGNYIGLAASGTVSLPNTSDGILGGIDMTFGGAIPGAGNVISGNFGAGMDLNDIFDDAITANDLIQGNFIGTDATGKIALSSSQGISITNRPTNMTIGGTSPAARNVISGNFFEGVEVANGVSGVSILGNYIGVDVTGSNPVPNGSSLAGSNNLPAGGISIGTFTGNVPTGASNALTTPFNVFIGGGVPGAGNVISGNQGNGVSTMGFDNTSDPNNTSQTNLGNFVMGNLIGTDATGVNAIPNTQNGIYLTMDAELASPAGGVIIGAAAVGSGNVVSFNTGHGILIDGGGSTNSITGNAIQHNGGAGVRIVSGTSNPISRNSIFGNAALGIDLDAVGPNAISHCQASATGANNLQNAPTLTAGSGSAFISATATDPSGNTSEFSNAVQESLSGSVVSLLGNFDSKASTTYTIEFFSSPSADASGFGQGQTFITSTTLTTGAGCTAPISNPVDLTQADVSVALSYNQNGFPQRFSQLSTGPDFGSQVYNAVVTNDGPATAHNVVLTDPLPASLQVSSVYCNLPTCQSPITTDLGNCTVNANTVTCNLGTLAPGATVAIKIPVQALATGSITNTVNASATETDPNLANNSASVAITSQNAFTQVTQISPNGLLTSAPDTPVIVYGTGFIPGVSVVTFTDKNGVTTTLPVTAFYDNQTCGFNSNVGTTSYCQGFQVTLPHSLIGTAGAASFTVTNPGGAFALSGAFTLADTCQFGSPFLLSTEFANSGTSTGGAIELDVTYNVPGCTFTPSADVPWIEVLDTPAPDHFGDLVVDFALAPNTGAARMGNINVGGQTIAISEDAGDNTVCAYTLNPTSATIPGGVGTYTVQVTPSSQSCSYSAASFAPWITVPQNSSSLTGTANVTYSVPANTGGPQTGSIEIAGVAFVVTQNPATSCFFTLSSNSALFSTGANTGSVNVVASLPTCSWTAATDSPSFVNITSGATGTGNGTINYSITANSGGQRNPIITVGNQQGASAVLNIAQASVAACSFTLSPTSIEVSSNGTSDTFTASLPFVTNSAGGSCTANAISNNPSALTVTGGGSNGNGQFSFEYIVAANPNPTPRTLTITAGCQTFTVNQDGAGAVSNPTPTITSLSPTGVVAGSGAFTLTVNGSGFVSGATVSFGGANKTTSFVSSTQVTASILAADVASVGTPAVLVTNPTPGGGASNSVNFNVTSSSNPVPTISGLSPAGATAGSGAFTLTVNGTNFISSSSVLFNGTARTTTFVSATQLTAAILAGDVASVGIPTVIVTNPTPGGGQSNAVNFSIVAGSNPVPTVTSLSPAGIAAGSGGFTLTVTGTNFVNGAFVNFGGANKVTTFVSSTQLTAAILTSDVATAGTPAVFVNNPNPGGGASNSINFNVTAASNPVPTVTTISPTSIAAGSIAFTLTVNGSNFVSNSVVHFNGAVKLTTFVSSTQLTAQLQSLDVETAGNAAVFVSNPTPGGGSSNSVNFTISGTTNPVPTLTSISPNTVSAGVPAFTMTLTGTNFVSNSGVDWNGAPQPTTFVNATTLTATISAADVQFANSASVIVVNPAPGGGTSNTIIFEITTPVSTLSSLVPNSAIAGGPGFTLTVNGSNFLNTATVQWNGANLTTTFVSTTQLTAAVPATDIASVGTATVVVFNPVNNGGANARRQGAPAGRFSNALTFTISAANPVPTLTSIAPTSTGAGGASFTMTLTGTNFVSGSVANWKGSARTTTFVSATQLTAAITAADIASSGTAAITVVNPTPGGGTSNSLTFTITDFSVTATTATQTITAGQSGNFTIATATVGGAFPGTVTFTTSGLPTGPSATFSPSSVSPGTSTTMTVNTTARASAELTAPPISPGKPMGLLMLIALTLLLASTTMFAYSKSSAAKFGRSAARRLIPISVFAVLLISVGYISGCSGGGFPKVGANTGTPAGSYTVTVTGTSGTDVHTTTVTLVVQ